MVKSGNIQKIAVLVDAQNLYHSAKNLYHAKVNFREVLKAAVDGRDLLKAMVYVIKSDVPEEASFFQALERAGFYLKMKDLQIFPGGLKKGDWDVGMAVDAISLIDKVDVIVLVGGDGDAVPLVEYLKNHGITVEVVAFGRSASAKLIAAAERFLDLEEDPKKFLLIKENRKSRMR